MRRKIRGTSVFTTFVLVVVVSAALQAHAQDTKTPYPSMASVDQYLMERNTEIALARTAAPESISRDAEVMVLGRHAYETAVKGKKRFRMHGVALMGRRDQRSRLLESQAARAGLLQSARRAIQRSANKQENRVGLGRAIQISDVRGHQYRF